MGTDNKDLKDIQFPFRAGSSAEQETVRTRLNDLIICISPCITQLARKISDNKLPKHLLMDIVQETLEKLCLVSMPQYDSWRKPFSAPATFAYTCSRNLIVDAIRVHGRRIRREKNVQWDDESTLNSMPAEDCSADASVVSTANYIIEHPEQFLSPAQVRVFRIYLANQHLPQKDIATMAGYECARTLSTTMKKIRQILADVDIDTYASAQRKSNPR